MKEKEQAKITHAAYLYHDNDINSYVDNIIKNKLGGYAPNQSFLLANPQKDYSIAVTPCTSSLQAAGTSIAYFLNSEIRQKTVVETCYDIFDETCLKILKNIPAD